MRFVRSSSRWSVAGSSLQRAGGVVGVSRDTATIWWRSSGLVTPAIQLGAIGGLPGTAPPGAPGVQGHGEQQRRPLTSEDRTAIAIGLMCQCSYAQIGSMIGRDKSVICREVARNRGPDGSYWAPVAHRAAHERRRRPKEPKLVKNPALCRAIEAWMDDGWSPGLIAEFLRQRHPGSDATAIMGRVSHETIYQALYVQTRGGLRADLHRQLSPEALGTQVPLQHRPRRWAHLRPCDDDQPATRPGRRPGSARTLGR